MNKIALIAPVRSIYDKARAMVDEKDLKDISIYYASLEDGEKLARKLEHQGVKIIISRGGTYQMIKDAVNIPVVEIKTTTYDLVESLGKVKGDSKKVAIVGYDRVITGFKSINELIDNKYKIISIETQDDILNAVNIANQEGINVFIGDSTVVELTKELNCESILLSSTKESINLAFDEALNILKLTRSIRRKNEELLAMLSNVHDGIIIINNNFEIVNINKKALDVIGGSKIDIIGEDIRDVVEGTKLYEPIITGEPVIGEIQTISNQKILTSRVPIFIDDEIIGAIATFKPIGEVLENEITVRKELYKKGFIAKNTFENIIFESESMKNCIEKAKVFAKYDAPVHIFGETGVGKELFSQSIHNESLRDDKPFVAINCAALPRNLIESELFGYEEGAFTGAKKKGKSGVFELAHGGTLFLDEINEIPIDLQGRLLRAIQENEIIRVGGEEIINVDVRLITSANKELLELVEQDKFREDLYYRIHVLAVKIPPLRKRDKDMVILSNYFLDKYSVKHNVDRIKLTKDVEDTLMSYMFCGNVRELENLIETSVLLGSFDELKEVVKRKNENKDYIKNLNLDKIKTIEEIEKEYISKVYSRNNENVEKTSSDLGISRTTLWRKLKNMEEN